MTASITRHLQVVLFSKVNRFFSNRFSIDLGAGSLDKSQGNLSNDNKKRILQTPIRFYPSIGGVENYVYYLSKKLVDNGNFVKVICADEPRSCCKNIHGISIERLAYSFKITNTNIAFSLPLKILHSYFDVLHTHMPTPWTADWSILIAKFKKKRSVITIHNDMDKASFLGKMITKTYLFTLFKLTLTLVDKIIIVNPDWENSFSATKKMLTPYKKKISIIPNGIDLSLFKKSDRGGAKENSLLFISVLDKHHKYKGLDYLLSSLRLLKRNFPDIELVVIGEGELKKYYQQKAELLGLSDNVRFIGEIKQEDLVGYYNAASVFILPSTEIEGFGIVLLEAMACNVPVVATSIVGTSSDIKEYNAGLVVEPKNAEDLAQAITTMLNNPALAKIMGNNGRNVVEEKYDWREVARQIERLYMV